MVVSVLDTECQGILKVWIGREISSIGNFVALVEY